MSIIIGMTGSIASGKTTLLKHMHDKGYKVFICDDYVKELYKKPEIISQIKKIFLNTDISNRKAIARIIYKDHQKRSELEKIIHPLVREEMNYFIQKNKDEKMLFLEVPLLFESGWAKNCNYIITLYCESKIRLKRALDRGIDEDIFKAINRIQMPEEEKKKRADYAIDTSANLDDVIVEFDKIVNNLI